MAQFLAVLMTIVFITSPFVCGTLMFKNKKLKEENEKLKLKGDFKNESTN